MYKCHLCNYSIDIKGSFRTHLNTKRHRGEAMGKEEEDKKIRSQMDDSYVLPKVVAKPSTKKGGAKKVAAKKIETKKIEVPKMEPRILPERVMKNDFDSDNDSDSDSECDPYEEEIRKYMEMYNLKSFKVPKPAPGETKRPRFTGLGERQELVDEDGLTEDELQEEYEKYREERRYRHNDIDRIFDRDNCTPEELERANRLKIDYMPPDMALRYGIKDYNPPVVGCRELIVQNNHVCISRDYDGLTNVDITNLGSSNDKLMTPHELLEFLNITRNGEINQPLIDKLVSYKKFNKPLKRTNDNPFTQNFSFDSDSEESD